MTVRGVSVCGEKGRSKLSGEKGLSKMCGENGRSDENCAEKMD